MQSREDVPVQQLMPSPQRSATGTLQPGRLVEKTARIEFMLGRVETEQHDGEGRGRDETGGEKKVRALRRFRWRRELQRNEQQRRLPPLPFGRGQGRGEGRPANKIAKRVQTPSGRWGIFRWPPRFRPLALNPFPHPMGRGRLESRRKCVRGLAHVLQWNCDFTSGFDITTRAQMPIGKPRRQQAEVQGIIARIVPVMHRP